MPGQRRRPVRDFATDSDVMSLCPLWKRTGAGLTRAEIHDGPEHENTLMQDQRLLALSRCPL
jgi:hypothetical protein